MHADPQPCNLTFCKKESEAEQEFKSYANQNENFHTLLHIY